MTYWTEPQTSSILEGPPLLWFVYKLVPNEATLHRSATKQAYPASLSTLFLVSRGMYQIQINKSNLNLAKQIVDYLVPLPLRLKGKYISNMSNPLKTFILRLKRKVSTLFFWGNRNSIILHTFSKIIFSCSLQPR